MRAGRFAWADRSQQLPRAGNRGSGTDFEPEGLDADITFRLETLGTFLNLLTARGVAQVCFAGAIRRPKIDLGAH